MLSRYGLLGFLKLICSLFLTKTFYRKARIIRFPFDIRNSKFIDLGDGLTTGVGCRFEAYPVAKEIVLTFGKDVEVNDYVHITAMKSVKIGNNVLLASKVYISDCTHGSYNGDSNDSSPLSIPKERVLVKKAVIIEDNVWIGEFVSVLPGVTIGSGTIVGANSVVTKNLPSNVIAVGSPAKPIKKYNFESQTWEKLV